MGSKNTTKANADLTATFATTGTLYLSLLTALASDAAEGTEVSTGTFSNYQRCPVACNSSNWNTAANAAITSKVDLTAFLSSGSTATIGSPGYVDVVGIGVHTSSSGASNQTYFMSLGSSDALAFTATTADVLTVPGAAAAGIVDTNTVVLDPIIGVSLPTGLSASTIYYVRDMSGDTFKLALTSGGTAIDITAAGSGMVQKLEVKRINNGDTITIPSGAIVIKES